MKFGRQTDLKERPILRVIAINIKRSTLIREQMKIKDVCGFVDTLTITCLNSRYRFLFDRWMPKDWYD